MRISDEDRAAALAVVGAGYRWMPCDRCGEVVLTARTPKCLMTPGCPGTHKPKTRPRPKRSKPEGAE